MITEERASSLFHLQLPVLATHITGLMCFLEHQEESALRGYVLNPDREVPQHSSNCCAGSTSLHCWFSGTCSRQRIQFLNKVFSITKPNSPSETSLIDLMVQAFYDRSTDMPTPFSKTYTPSITILKVEKTLNQEPQRFNSQDINLMSLAMLTFFCNIQLQAGVAIS